MTVSLDANIDASVIHLRVNAPVDDPAPYYKIDNEIVQVRSYQELEADGALKLVPNYTRWTVERGQAATAKASHLSGATMTPLYPQVGNPALDTGGGAAEPGTVVVTPPLEVDVIAALEAANAPDGSNPVATLDDIPAKDFYAQDTDPGAVGSGSVWKDTSSSNALWERNAANDGWDARFVAWVEAVADAEANVSATATASGLGAAFASRSAISEDGNADARATAETSGPFAGQANASPTATTDNGYAAAGPVASATGSGTADVSAAAVATESAVAGSIATRGAESVGMLAVVDATSARMAFNGTTPIAIPELPATPDAQDIADVLVALGLVTQAP